MDKDYIQTNNNENENENENENIKFLELIV